MPRRLRDIYLTQPGERRERGRWIKNNGRAGRQQPQLRRRRKIRWQVVDSRHEGRRHRRKQRDRVSFFSRKSVVEELAKLGVSVHTCCRKEAELTECLREWKGQGFRVAGYVCDLSVREQREELMRTVSSTFDGKLNILINNVRTNIRKNTVEFSPEDFSFLVSTNLESAYHMCQLCYPLLKAS